MKLNDNLKKQIDQYFESVTPEYLFDLAVTKYKFVEVLVEVSGNFTSVHTKHFGSIDTFKDSFSTSQIDGVSNYTIAA